jgi:hypothetical protein
MGVVCRTYGGRQVYTGVWWVNLGERDQLEDPGVDGKIPIKMELQEVGCGARTGLSWLRIGTSDGNL